MKIFVDDIRRKPTVFDLRFMTGESFLDWLKAHPDVEIEHISFDHDLGPHVMSGYDLVKKLVELGTPIQKVTFHTDNFVGLKNMVYYFRSAKKNGLYPEAFEIDNHKYDARGEAFERTSYYVS